MNWDIFWAGLICLVVGGIIGFIIGALVYRNNVDVFKKTESKLKAKLEKIQSIRSSL